MPDTLHLLPAIISHGNSWLSNLLRCLKRSGPCYHKEWFKEAPHILVVAGAKDKAWTRSYDRYNSIETDMAIAMTHLILAAENEGVGTCWIEAYNPAILRDALKLDDNQVVFAITPLGYPRKEFSKKGNKNRKSLAEIVEYL